jgi:ribosomal protein S18 acetylase RimI-like enzyme
MVPREATGRKATLLDLPGMTRTLVRAFAGDPVWGGWAFPDRERAAAQRALFFALWIEMALRHDFVWVTPGCEAVASWFPPGTGEDTPEDYARLLRLAHDHLGGHAATFLAGQELIERSRPAEPRHYYLSIIGTDPAHRGLGLGRMLLDLGLAVVDRERFPAYLESTNHANLPLYESRGFQRIGSYALPDGPTMDQMWRDIRPR